LAYLLNTGLIEAKLLNKSNIHKNQQNILPTILLRVKTNFDKQRESQEQVFIQEQSK